MINYLNAYFIFLLPAIFLVGMFFGNILNIIATQIPCALKINWRRQCHDYLDINQINNFPEKKVLQCQHCEYYFPAWVTLPFIRIFLFKEICKKCRTPFTIRYSMTEITTALISTLIIYYFRFSSELIPYLILAWGLILLIITDHEHYLLPDAITLPLLWFGLFLNSFTLFTPTQDAILGAISGYLSLFVVSRIFKYFRGIEGLGLGDCKLFAVFGAWWGINALLPILLIASLAGSAIGIIKMLFNKQPLEAHIPFGPFLILGAVLTCVAREVQ